MTYQTEFPDFPASDMPAIPAGFEDASWHNDACPLFLNEKAGLMIWIDFSDVTKREFEDGSRFGLVEYTAEGGPGREVISTDDWAEVLAKIEARQ